MYSTYLFIRLFIERFADQRHGPRDLSRVSTRE